MKLLSGHNKGNSSSDGALPPNRRRPAIKKKEKSEERKKKETGKPGRKKRFLIAALRFFVTLAISGATVYAGIVAYRHATSSKYFAAQDFEVTGMNRLSEPEILRTAVIERGTNIFRVDIEKAVSLLEGHPWIAKAEVRRRLPRYVKIDVTERVAKAIVLFDVPYLVDDEGTVFKRWVRGDPSPAPVLTGFTREQFITDRDAVVESIRDGIDLAKRYRSSGLERIAPLTEIHNEVDGDLSLALSGDPVYVRFGRGPYRNKLKRLATLLSRLKSDGQRAAMIFFDNEVRPDRVTVKLKRGPRKELSESEVSSSGEKIQKRMSKI